MMGDDEEEWTDDRLLSANPCSSLSLPSFPSQSGEDVHLFGKSQQPRGQRAALLTANKSLRTTITFTQKHLEQPGCCQPLASGPPVGH